MLAGVRARRMGRVQRVIRLVEPRVHVGFRPVEIPTNIAKQTYVATPIPGGEPLIDIG
jgi:hypothetical protein